MKSPSVTNYKNVNPTETELTITEKVKGKYFSYLSLKQGPLFLQTSTLQIKEANENSIQFQTKKDGQFSQLLKSLDTALITYISERSTQVFRGNLFSRNK